MQKENLTEMRKSFFISLTLVIIFSLLAVSRTMDRFRAAPPLLKGMAELTSQEVVADPSMHEALYQFEKYIYKSVEDNPVPGLAIAIVKDDKLIYRKTIGVRDVETAAPVDEHTVFRIASLSKGFAPVLTGLLAEEGCLNWEDKVLTYLPNLELKNPKYAQQLNLLHVLSHTTGLPRHAYSNLVNDGVPYDTILQKLKNVKFTHAPGTFYNYQNVVFSLIGDVIEKATRQSYEEALTERLFKPLGMRDASASYLGFLTTDNVAMPHMPIENGYRRIDMVKNWYEVGPAAGVNASISDMAEWLQLLLGNRPDVASDDVLHRVLTPYVRMSNRDGVVKGWSGLERAWYALGWRVVETEDRVITYHGGFVNGYRSEIAFDREAKIGIAILSNGHSWGIAGAIPKFFELYDRRKEIL
jgi:beta-lactamase class C